MTYPVTIPHISHWHEHEIHDRISAILESNTWLLGVAKYDATRSRDDEIDLTIKFKTKADYERCRKTIAEVRRMPSR